MSCEYCCWPRCELVIKQPVITNVNPVNGEPDCPCAFCPFDERHLSVPSLLSKQPTVYFRSSARCHIINRYEAEFLDVIRTKVFPLCYSHSPLLTDLSPPPPSKSGLKLVSNVKIVTETISLRTLTSTKLYSTFMNSASRLNATENYATLFVYLSLLYCNRTIIKITVICPTC